MLAVSDTHLWIVRASENPSSRHPAHLPATLDFRPWSHLFERLMLEALPGTEIGCPIVARPEGLSFPTELAWQASYPARLNGATFVGTFHVHPEDKAPTFDAQDLANVLRSDNSGFVDLLMANGKLQVLVRTNPFTYVSAHHVNRNPLLLQETHTEQIRRHGPDERTDADYTRNFRRATRYFCHRYQLAFYEGGLHEELKRVYTPEAVWR